MAQSLQSSILEELTDMKNIKFTATNFLLILILSASAVFAANLTADNDKAVALVAQNLSAKLKTDLVSNNLSIKFTNVEKSDVSNKEVVLKGEAKAVLPSENTELPFKFEASVNTSDEVINNIEYAFVESSSYEPTTDEEFLMKNLLQKLAADYKTENVVIAIDGFDTENTAGNQKEFKGLAEVRVGEVEWKRIDFDVVLNDENKASKVEYSLRK